MCCEMSEYELEKINFHLATPLLVGIMCAIIYAARRKPGPKPRRVSSSPLPPPGPTPSASLAQLFAAADSPRPSSSGEETDSTTHHKVIP